MIESTRVNNMEDATYGMTANQTQAFMYGPTVFFLYFGRVDDTEIIHSSANCNFANFFVSPSGGPGGLGGIPWVEISDSDLDVGGVVMTSGQVHINGSRIGGLTLNGVLASRPSVLYVLNPAVNGFAELTLTNNDMGFGDGVDSQGANAIVDLNFDDATDPTVQDFPVRIEGNRFYIGTGAGATPLDKSMIYVHSATTNEASALITGNTFLNATLSHAWSNAVIACLGPVVCLASNNAINSNHGGSGNFFYADTDSGHVVTGNFASYWSIGYPTKSGSSVFANNSGIVNPLAIASGVASAGGYIVPTGRIFHVTNSSVVNRIVPSIATNEDVTPLSEITVIADVGFTFTTGGTPGGIAIAGSAPAGQAISFVYDTGTGLWYPNYH